jgi:hypothetical protein
MSSLQQNCAPENTSLLNPNEFRIVIHRAPYLQFFTQTVALPSINLQPAETNNPFVRIAQPGDHIDFEDLSVHFLVDEDLKGYMEIYNWMRGLGFPETFEEYKQLVADKRYNNLDGVTKSDISVFTNTGSRKANVEFLFRDAHPVMLSAPTLTTTNTDQPVVTAKALFAYTLFDVKTVI